MFDGLPTGCTVALSFALAPTGPVSVAGLNTTAAAIVLSAGWYQSSINYRLGFHLHRAPVRLPQLSFIPETDTFAGT